MANAKNYDGIDEYVINYIDSDGLPCTWIGTEAGLASSERNYEIQTKVKLEKNVRDKEERSRGLHRRRH